MDGCKSCNQMTEHAPDCLAQRVAHLKAELVGLRDYQVELVNLNNLLTFDRDLNKAACEALARFPKPETSKE